MRSPEKLFFDSTTAVVLSASDNHATVLLRSKDINKTKSLLKLTVTPTHKDVLAPTISAAMIEDLENTQTDEPRSLKILVYLRSLDFSLTSESGAEYSYFIATEKPWWKNPFRLLESPTAGFSAELISPASDRQIERALPAPSVSLVEETPALYESIVKPRVQSILASGSLSWIHSILNGTKEAERLLLNSDDFVLVVDTKWRSHPDPKTTSRDEWHGHKSVEDLYCLAIVKDATISSLRDLRGGHVPMLRCILSQSRQAIANVYGVTTDQLRIFVHYQPQFYHFHVHFTRLHNEYGCHVERCHLLFDIIQNLEADSEYYTKRTISYKLNSSSELYMALHTELTNKTD